MAVSRLGVAEALTGFLLPNREALHRQRIAEQLSRVATVFHDEHGLARHLVSIRRTETNKGRATSGMADFVQSSPRRTGLLELAGLLGLRRRRDAVVDTNPGVRRDTTTTRGDTVYPPNSGR